MVEDGYVVRVLPGPNVPTLLFGCVWMVFCPAVTARGSVAAKHHAVGAGPLPALASLFAVMESEGLPLAAALAQSIGARSS